MTKAKNFSIARQQADIQSALLLSDDSSKTTEIFTNTASTFQSLSQSFINLPSRMPAWNFKIDLLGWLWAPFLSLKAGLAGFTLFPRKSSEELRMSLDEDKLQLLMTHIDSYIDTVIGQRFDEKQKAITKEVDEKVTKIIAVSLKEANVSQQGSSNKLDIEAILTRVRDQMNKELNDREKVFLIQLAKSNDERFLKLQEQIKLNIIQHFTEIKLTNQKIDLDEIIAAILGSEKLLTLIDLRLKPTIDVLNVHDADINTIKLDLAAFKSDILQRFTSFDSEITRMKQSQENFGDQFYKFKLENEEKLQQLVVEFDRKLLSHGESQHKSINASVRKTLLAILGFDSKSVGNAELSEEHIKNWISSVFVAKSDFEDRLKLVEANGNKAFKLQLEENAGILMTEINEEIKKQVALVMAENAKKNSGGDINVSGGLTEAMVLKIVKDVLAIYDADKTGLIDFALESAGGQILSTRCTENYQVKSAEISIFGIPLWYPSNTPRTVISPSVQPGECWAFQGFPGFLVVKLNNLVQITGFSIEHIPQALAPNGIIDSAPNNFSVWGLETEMDKDPILLGNYNFSAEKDAPSLQYFPVLRKEIEQPYQIIELRVESNHGNPRYTCLYRFRVHGNVVKS